MKRLLLYSATLALLCSCSIIGPAFTGLTPGTAAVSAGPNKQIGRRYTPAQDPATGLYGYINDFGMWVIAPKYDYVQAFGSSGMARVKVGNRYGAIDPTGQLVIPLVFSSGSNATAAIQSIEKGRLPGIERDLGPGSGVVDFGPALQTLLESVAVFPDIVQQPGQVSLLLPAKRPGKGHAGKGCALRPSARTLAFLKLFARNYQVERQLPEGLQGLFVG